MKKIYFLASVLLASVTLQAQTTIDFEELELEENSFYDGSDGVGQFTSNGATFSNYFEEEWAMWLGGFSYSNMTDNTTGDYTNPASAFPASGAEESNNYGIFNTSGEITFQNKVNLNSVALTNTTYAYISMRDGDGFAKKFGENGDADFFFIDIYGIHGQDTIATKRFYLADFTSENEEDHYIIDSWETVDLSAFEDISSIGFEFSSSDIGDYGINTPQFFALDNLMYTESTSALTIETLAQFSMYPNPASSEVKIDGEAGEYTIVNMNGQIVSSFINDGFTTINVANLEAGVYFVQNRSVASKRMKLIIK